MTHIQINIPLANNISADLLVYLLEEISYSGFEEDDEQNQLKAYIEEDKFNEQDLQQLLFEHKLSYTKQTIEPQNWNALWESNFESILIDDVIGIRANFHPPFKQVKHEIIITPKMSFGTGHHATTYMVLQLMQQLNFSNKSVYDFGTGTGILAIHASQLGASEVWATDNDDWCIENATENLDQNNISNVTIQKVETAFTNKVFDIVLANVNLNIIQDNVSYLANATTSKGYLIVSGIMQQDEDTVTSLFKNYGFSFMNKLNKDGGMWIAMLFEKE